MRRAITGILILLLLVAAFAGPGDAAAEPSSELKIGVIATLSRLGEYQGRQALRGIELAKAALDRDPKAVKLSTVIEDSQADPAHAVTALKKLIAADHVRFVIGDSWNSSTVPLLPLVNREKVLLISPVAALNQLTADDYFFRTMPSVSSMMEKLARFSHDNLGLKRIGILFQENPFGIEHRDLFIEKFTSLGGEITAVEAVDGTSTDVRSQLLKLKRSAPDGILNLHLTGPAIGLVMRQGKQLGISSTWLTHFGAHDANLFRDYGADIEGLHYPYPCTELGGDPDGFAGRYRAVYGEEPDLIAGNAYDAAMLIALAVKAVGPAPDDVKQYLLSNHRYSGAFGPIRFDSNGDVERTITIRRVHEGRGVVVPETGGRCAEGAA